MSLISQLQSIQQAEGHLSEAALRELAAREKVPLYRLQGLVSFYPHFRTQPAPRYEVALCRDMSCWLRDGLTQAAQVRSALAGRADVHVQEVSCLGRCDDAPAAAVHDVAAPLARLLAGGLDAVAAAELPPPRRWRCDPYPGPADHFGLLRDLLARPLAELPARAVAALKDSGLRGMGGAGFPTATKWELVARESRQPKYVVCNADESEPGTFKDRVILSDLPHLVIEGMILAGLVIGAERGILFIRHEYGPERRRFEEALHRARQAGWLGPGLRDRGVSFEIEVFVSPGGYILGEETALLEALEDKRGEPRNKPPFPGTHGLHGQPTLINNVETLAMVPGIVRRGADWWKAQGKDGFHGLKFMAVSGHVERPGVYEIAVGTTVRELLTEAGGVQGGRPLKAFAPGGASSNFLPARQLDVPLDFQALAQAGSMLGSGALVVVAEGTDMLALATNVVRFFRNESCGKCVPCRLGSHQAVQVLEEVQAGRADRMELAVLPDLAEAMALTSICGLGQVALNPVLSVQRHWPEEVQGLPGDKQP